MPATELPQEKRNIKRKYYQSQVPREAKNIIMYSLKNLRVV